MIQKSKNVAAKIKRVLVLEVVIKSPEYQTLKKLLEMHQDAMVAAGFTKADYDNSCRLLSGLLR